MTEDESRGGGRPRDASIDERVLSATRELLLEVGWDEPGRAPRAPASDGPA